MSEIWEKIKENSWKKNVTLFLSSQAVSLFGSSIVQYAIIWYITLTTQSGLMMTISTLAWFVPQVIISVFAGVWADRFSRKKLIMMADAWIAWATLIVAIVMLFGYDDIVLLFLVLAIRSFGAGIQGPAVTSFIPVIVPTEKLMRVNGINTMIQSTMLILSPIVSASLIALFPLGKILFVDVITAIIWISVFAFVKVTEIHKKSGKIDYFKDVKEWIKYIKWDVLIKNVFILFIIFSILFWPLSFLTPLMVTRTFGDDVWYLTLNEIIFFVWTMLGWWLISIWGWFKNKIQTVAVASLALWLVSVALWLSTTLTVFLIFMWLCWIVMNFIQTPIMVLLQEWIIPEYQWRVFSLLNMVMTWIMPLGMVLYWPLADMISVEVLLIVTWVLFMAVSLLIYKNKNLMPVSQK